MVWLRSSTYLSGFDVGPEEEIPFPVEVESGGGRGVGDHLLHGTDLLDDAVVREQEHHVGPVEGSGALLLILGVALLARAAVRTFRVHTQLLTESPFFALVLVCHTKTLLL